MKKLIDEIPLIINHQLEGFGLAYPNLAVDIEHRFVCRSEVTRRGKVAVISGGGSGHEPLHGGYVGFGMLDGACMGEIFTSSTPDQIIACAKTVEAGAGVLCIVKNYTGDRLNFEMAVELLNGQGIPTRMVLIDDDVGVKDGILTAGRIVLIWPAWSTCVAAQWALPWRGVLYRQWAAQTFCWRKERWKSE